MNYKPGRELQEFNSLYRETDSIYHKLALHAGLSDSAFQILYSIVEFGDGCLQKDISTQYNISKQTINSSIKNLEAKGYLTLSRGKGRDMHLHLTPAGEAFTEEYIVPVFDAENHVFAQMTPEETAQMLRLTKKYTELFRKNADEKILHSSKEVKI